MPGPTSVEPSQSYLMRILRDTAKATIHAQSNSTLTFNLDRRDCRSALASGSAHVRRVRRLLNLRGKRRYQRKSSCHPPLRCESARVSEPGRPMTTSGNRRHHLRHYPYGPGDNRRPVTVAKPRPKNKVTPFPGTLSQNAASKPIASFRMLPPALAPTTVQIRTYSAPTLL